MKTFISFFFEMCICGFWVFVLDDVCTTYTKVCILAIFNLPIIELIYSFVVIIILS